MDEHNSQLERLKFEVEGDCTVECNREKRCIRIIEPDFPIKTNDDLHSAILSLIINAELDTDGNGNKTFRGFDENIVGIKTPARIIKDKLNVKDYLNSQDLALYKKCMNGEPVIGGEIVIYNVKSNIIIERWYYDKHELLQFPCIKDRLR